MYLECANDSTIDGNTESSIVGSNEPTYETVGDCDTYSQSSARSFRSAPTSSSASSSKEANQSDLKNLAAQPCDLQSTLEKIPALPQEAQQAAIEFILEFGTNLQRERLLYHFPINVPGAQNSCQTPSNLNVLAALSHYQNEDGGFGHGLEADLRTKQSSVIATSIGLQILESVNALDSKLADRALQYLVTHFTPRGWSAIHKGCNDAPHAPWWKYEAQTSEFLANPSVEILKFLLIRNTMARETSVLLKRAIEYLANEPIEMHELLCYTRLYECGALSKEHRLLMLPHLLSHGYRLVNVNQSDWEEYCLTPLSVVSKPTSIFAEFFNDTLRENFEFLLESQNETGSWSPNWSWAGEFPSTWKVVETEIKAEVTLQNLRQFSLFGACSP